MIRYNIHVNYGDKNITKKFFFIHRDYETISQEQSDKAFDDAVKELNKIYKTYGRFATETGITKLFSAFGFERTVL